MAEENKDKKSDDPAEANGKTVPEAKPVDKPAAAPAPAAKPAAAAAQPAPAAARPAPRPAPPKPKLITPKFNYKNGRLLGEERLWPTDVWADPWARPSFVHGVYVGTGLVLAALIGAGLIGEISVWADKIYAILMDWAAVNGLSGLVAQTGWSAIKVLVVFHLIAVAPLFLIWWERKISAHIQSRLGPMYVGGFHGWAQTIADGIKLFLKETVQPAAADKWVYLLAPIIAAAPAVFAFAPVYFGDGLVAANIDIGILYIFAVTGVSVIGIMMGGWGSGNKYSLLGGLRAAAQLVSYELPRTFSLVPVILLVGSLNLVAIVDAQTGYWLGAIPRWFIFYPVMGQIAFVIFLIASIAETNRIPFDIPEAESELVAGFHTEYGGMRFGLFFFAEYAYVFLSAALIATFFFGGGHAPLPFLNVLPSWFWFFLKTGFFAFCFLWFRWTFPRFRVDRLMDFNWKFLLPWSFANIAFGAVYLFI